MGRDPLEQFKRQPQPPYTPQPPQRTPPPVPPPVPPAPPMDEELEPPREFDSQTGEEIYKAIYVYPRKRDRLEIRPAIGVWATPRYFDLADIIPNRRAGTEIVLIYPAYDVFIKGRNLQRAYYALKEARCDFIEAYDPQTFARVTDHEAPFIESIIIVPKNKQAAGAPQAESKGDKVH